MHQIGDRCLELAATLRARRMSGGGRRVTLTRLTTICEFFDCRGESVVDISASQRYVPDMFSCSVAGRDAHSDPYPPVGLTASEHVRYGNRSRSELGIFSVFSAACQ
jgi:hypothetical protein